MDSISHNSETVLKGEKKSKGECARRMCSVWVNPRHLKNTWRLVNLKYLRVPIYITGGKACDLQ